MLSLKSKLSSLTRYLLISISSSSSGGSRSSSYNLLTALFSTTPATQSPPSFLIEFLTKSCGLSPDKAARAAVPIAHLRSLSNPESVLLFLRRHGFSPAHIASLLSREPRLLAASVPTTLEPKMESLRRMGFSSPDLLSLVSDNPSTLRVCNLRPKIDFWRSIFLSDDDFLKASRRNVYLLTSSLDARIIPNISLLRDCGISDRHIRTLIIRSPRFVTWRPDRLKVLIERTEALGVPRGSNMYWHVLQSVVSTSKATFDAKLDLLRSCGWSEAEILSALRKTPVLLRLSEGKIRSTIEFLLKETGCEPSYIAALPVLLTYSLEKRLIPRCYVLRSLKAKELLLGGRNLFSAIKITDEQFLKKFILPHVEAVPELEEMYAAACASKVSSPVPA